MAWKNIQAQKQLYFPYVLSSIATVAMFTMIASLLMNDFVEEQGATLTTLMGMGAVIVGVFSLVFIFYTNSFLMKRRKKELGLYNLLGLEKKHISSILGLESLLVGGFSIVAGILTGILFGFLSFLLLNYLLRLPVSVSYSISLEIVGLTIILFAGIFLATTVYNIIQISLVNPIQLLKGAKEGEKEPKSSPVVLIIGVVSLIAGYGISLTITDPVSALTQFFLAVLLVIIGTYCLFTAGSIFILKAMKKNKSFYYRPGPFISISGMLYRMKQHAIGLANISILSVMVIIAISTTVTLYVGSEETLNNRFPANNNLSVMTNEDISGEELGEKQAILFDRISEMSNEKNIEISNKRDYRFLDLTSSMEGNVLEVNNSYNEPVRMIATVLPLDDFNQLTGQNRTLSQGEVLVYSAQNKVNTSTLVLGEETYQVEQLEQLPEPLASNNQLLEATYIIAPSVEAVDKMQADYNNDSNNVISYWSSNIYWDIDGDSDTQIEYAADVNNLVENNGLEIGAFFESRAASQQEWYSLNGGFLFLGVFLGGLFTLGAALITYFKQVSEGYDDRERIQIMQKVGLDKETTRKATHSQIVWMFTLPILTAAVHTAFAYPIIQKLLVLFSITSHRLLILCTVGVVGVFALVYWIIYRITSKVYLSIVE